MKKVFVLVVALCLVFLTTAIVAAEDNTWNVYFDLGVSGSSSNTENVPPLLSPPSKTVLDFKGTSGYLIGGEYEFGSFLVVAEYTSNSFQNSKVTGDGSVVSSDGMSKYDYSSSTTLIRGGYYFINNDKFKFNGLLGYMGLSVDNKGTSQDLTNGGPLVGLDATYNCSDKFSLNGSYCTTVGATSSIDALDTMNPDSKSSNLTTYRIKGLYKFTDSLGAYLSYSALTSSLKYSYAFGDIKDVASWNGWALGMDYKF
jgi:hypothetical protein